MSLQSELEQKRKRLDAYIAREAEMLSPLGVKSYTTGPSGITRYDTSLKDVQEAISRLQREIAELEAALGGRSPRLAVGAVPRDW